MEHPLGLYFESGDLIGFEWFFDLYSALERLLDREYFEDRDFGPSNTDEIISLRSKVQL